MKKMREMALPRRRLALLLTLCLLLAYVPIWAAASEVTVEVASLLGTVTVKRAASEKTFNAFVGLKLKQGDVVTVASGGEVVINIGTDKTIKALSDSSFKISSLSGSDSDSQAGFTLIKGTVFNEVRAPQSSTDGMTVRTGNTVAGVRGTTYTVSLRAVDGVTVRTLEGSVFLDTVLGRIEADTNASLISEKQTVDAGQGASSFRDEVYQLSLTDFTATELAYVAAHPDTFTPEVAAEAQILLEDMPTATQPAAQEQRQIIYETEPATTAVDEDADDVRPTRTQPSTTEPSTTEPSTTEPTTTGPTTTGPAPTEPPETRTLTIRYGGDADYSGYYGVTVTLDITQANMSERLYDYLKYNCGAGIFPCKVGYSVYGWSLSNTGIEGISGSRDFYGDHTLADLPADSHVTLYPLFAAGGDIGTSVNPYNIDQGNFPHFNAFARSNPDKYYKLQDDIDYASYAWPAGWQWTPIGTGAAPFTGSFYGNEKTIRNFSMTTTQQYAGFFGCVKGAGNNLVVTHLALDNVAITASSSAAVGGLVGNLMSGIIENCMVGGAITVSGSTDLNAGGLVGLADQLSVGSGPNPMLSASVKSCSFVGDVTATSTGNSPVFAGGIAGQFKSFALTDCTADASITATSAALISAGGIVGWLSGSACERNSYVSSNGRISGSGGNPVIYLGGVAGYAAATMKQCLAKGSFTVHASATKSSYVGGLVGLNQGSGIGIEESAVVGGSIEATAGSSILAGGLAGIVDEGDILNCYVAQTSVAANGTNSRTGGIVGWATRYIEKCHVRGVSLTVSNLPNVYAGGIVGYSPNSIRHCAVYSGSINAGTPTSNASFGRIVVSSSATVDNCFGIEAAFAIGNNVVDSSNPSGGLDGSHVSTIGQSLLGNAPCDWDFTDIWRWDAGQGYPILRNVPIP